MSSIAFHGGPMNTMPASVHFRAKAEFSLNYRKEESLAEISCHSSASRARVWPQQGGSIAAQTRATYKAIARVNTPTPFFLRNLDNPVAIQVGRYRAQIKRKRRAQRMLRPTIGISVKSCNADSMLRSSPANASSKIISSILTEFKMQSSRQLRPYIQCNLTTISNQN